MNRFTWRMRSAALCAITIAAMAGAAHAEIALTDSLSLSGTATLTSDYVYRGITQNDEDFTPQLGVDLTHDSGVYVGLWTSTVDFNDGDQAEFELDTYVGYSHESGPWSWDVRYTYFFYPGAAPSFNYNYGEFSTELAYDFEVLSLGGLLAYSPNFTADSGDAEYVQAKLDVPLPYDFALHSYVGKQFVDDNVAYGFPDAVDWNIGASYSYEDFDFDLSYIDTDMSRAECADGCEARIVATVNYNF